MINTRVYYRIIMPQNYCDIDFSTLQEAHDKLYGMAQNQGEYTEYWKEIQSEAYIVKVIELTEKIPQQ